MQGSSEMPSGFNMGGAGGAGGAGAGGAGGAEGLAPFASIQQLHGRMNEFWERKNREVEKLDPSDENETEFKTYELPLARIKKIMKLDDSVKMISSEAPMVFAKACELFIEELTLRAWTQTEESKRRTLQKHDISSAVAKSDMFDFLIDIVPRDDLRASRRPEAAGNSLYDATTLMMLQQQQLLQFLQQQSELNPQLALGALAGKGADGRDTGRSEADSRGAQSRPVSASVSGAGPRRGADPRMANAQANAWRDALAASGGAGGRLHDPRGADPTAMASLQALAASGNLSADMLQALQHSYLDPSTVASLQGMGLHSGHVDMGRGGRGGFM